MLEIKSIYSFAAPVIPKDFWVWTYTHNVCTHDLQRWDVVIGSFRIIVLERGLCAKPVCSVAIKEYNDTHGATLYLLNSIRKKEPYRRCHYCRICGNKNFRIIFIFVILIYVYIYVCINLLRIIIIIFEKTWIQLIIICGSLFYIIAMLTCVALTLEWK